MADYLDPAKSGDFPNLSDYIDPAAKTKLERTTSEYLAPSENLYETVNNERAAINAYEIEDDSFSGPEQQGMSRHDSSQQLLVSLSCFFSCPGAVSHTSVSSFLTDHDHLTP